MGLSVNVYTRVVKVPEGVDYDFQAFVITEDWEWKIKNLEKDAHYIGTPEEVNVSYPYSSHTEFRIALMQLFMEGVDRLTWLGLIEENLDMPFGAFIDFADNEGCLDWEVSKSLYEDFVTYKDQFEKMHPGWAYAYSEWMETFKVASEKNGVVNYC